MENQYLLQLMLSKGIGDVTIKKLLNITSQYPDITMESLCKNLNQLQSIIRCREETLTSIQQNFNYATELYNQITEKNILIITEKDSLYPQNLKTSLGNQCPPVLFAKGNLNLLSTSSIGFCGSRKVSSKGIVITEQCVEQLVGRNLTIVSGYANGTDVAAHLSAIKNGGNTVFVLAEGLLKYTLKSEFKNNLNVQNHIFISQFLPNQLWNVGNAMKRNSVIIGLSKAMILVESGKQGGTFAAGEESLKRQIPLFVIDYAAPEVSAEANPYFIERGGFPIRGRKGIPNLSKVFDIIDNHNYIPKQLKLDL